MKPEHKRAALYSGGVGLILACLTIIARDQHWVDLSIPQDIPVNAVSWNRIHDQVIAPRCLPCHGLNGRGAGDVNLDTEKSALDNIGRIRASALINRRMPPDRPLTRREYAELRAWVDGATPDKGRIR